MNKYESRFAMSMFASKADREAAINKAMDRAAEKRNWAADEKGNVWLALSYQQEIDELLELREQP